MKRSLKKGLPGGPNEKVFSTDGYRSTSPDVNNPFNIIPSGSITMKEKDGSPLRKGPLMGTDNLGNSQMMFPGADYQFPGNMVIETPLAKKGGSFQNSNIYATNKLFAVNKLFKKRKKGKRARGVYNPKAKYTYQPGGEIEYNQLPKNYQDALKNFVAPEVINLPEETDTERYGYDAALGVIYQNPNDPIENMNNPWWGEHELFHHLQNQAGAMSTYGTVGQRPNPYVASDEAIGSYYDRRGSEFDIELNKIFEQNPDISEEEAYTIAEENLYRNPTSVEGEARNYEGYIEAGNPSMFPKKQQGGSSDLPEDVGIGYLPDEERSYYNPLIDTVYLNPNASEEEFNHEMAHAWQNRQDGFRSDPYSPKLRPSAAASDEQAATYFNRKGDDVDRYINNLKTIVPELGGHTWNEDLDRFIPDQLKYDKVIDPLMYSDPSTLEGEAEYMSQVYGRPPLGIKKDGGAFEIELSDDDIDKYVKGGYVVEDISVPSLNRMDDGGSKPKKDKWGRPSDGKWYGFDPKTKKYTLGEFKGKTFKERETAILNKMRNSPEAKELNAFYSKPQSAQMIYPEVYAMGPGAGVLGLAGRTAAKGISNLAKSSLVQGTKAALNVPIANIPGATIGNAISSGFAADALVNRLPEIPSQIAEGNYLGALENTATGVLDLTGANMMSPLVKSIGKGIDTGAKLLPEVINYGADVIGTSRNAGKLQLPKYKNVYRAEHSEFDLPAIDNSLTGRWFADKPEEVAFYVRKLKDPNTGEVIMGSDASVRILKKRLPEYKVNQNFGAGMPEEARTMSMGKGDLTDIQLNEFLGPGADRRFKKGVFTQGDLNSMSTAPFLYNPTEGILDPTLVNQLRKNSKLFEGKADAMKYLFEETEKIKNAKPLQSYLPFNKQGGVVSNLTKKEIDKLIKQGYIIEEID